MKVIIPMSGMSSRFIAAGYTIPKYLIEVDGKTIYTAKDLKVGLFTDTSTF